MQNSCLNRLQARKYPGRLVFQSDGLVAELKDVVVRPTPTLYDLPGDLNLQASTEVITELAGGMLPDRLQAYGPVELAGKAAGHIRDATTVLSVSI